MLHLLVMVAALESQAASPEPAPIPTTVTAAPSPAGPPASPAASASPGSSPAPSATPSAPSATQSPSPAPAPAPTPRAAPTIVPSPSPTPWPFAPRPSPSPSPTPKATVTPKATLPPRPAASPSESTNGIVAGAAIARTQSLWAAAWNAKNAHEAAAQYTEDAVFYTTIHGSVTGRPTIERLFQQAFAAATPHIELRTGAIEISGSLAVDSGTYSQKFTAQNTSFEVHGSYLMVMRRLGSRWLIIRYMFTEDAQPQPTPQPTPQSQQPPRPQPNAPQPMRLPPPAERN